MPATRPAGPVWSPNCFSKAASVWKSHALMNRTSKSESCSPNRPSVRLQPDFQRSGSRDLSPELGRRNDSRVVQVLLDGRRIRGLLATLREPGSVQPPVRALELRVRTHVERHGVASSANLAQFQLAAGRPVVGHRDARIRAQRLSWRRGRVVVIDPKRARRRAEQVEAARHRRQAFERAADLRVLASMRKRRHSDCRRLPNRGLVGHRCVHRILRSVGVRNRCQRRAVTGRRYAVSRLERPGERLLTSISRAVGYALDRQFAGDQLHRGPVQAQPSHGVGHGLPTHRAVDPVKVVRRQARHVCQRCQVNRVIKVIRKPPEHPFQADGVIVCPGCLSTHRRNRSGPVLI